MGNRKRPIRIGLFPIKILLTNLTSGNDFHKYDNERGQKVQSIYVFLNHINISANKYLKTYRINAIYRHIVGIAYIVLLASFASVIVLTDGECEFIPEKECQHRVSDQ